MEEIAPFGKDTPYCPICKKGDRKSRNIKICSICQTNFKDK